MCYQSQQRLFQDFEMSWKHDFILGNLDYIYNDADHMRNSEFQG